MMVFLSKGSTVNLKMFLKLTIIAALAGWFGGCSAAQLTKQANTPPNFVIIFADDLGYGDLSCYGHPTIATPQLDRMADEGQRWTHFYSAAVVCSPSRAALMTGKYPVRTGTSTGVFFEWSAEGLAPDEVTLAETLKANGYATACVGKWHLGHRRPYLPGSQGFDEYYGIPYSNDMRVDPEMPVADDVRFREGMTLEKMRDPANKKTNWVPLVEDDLVVEYPADQTMLTGRYTDRCVSFIKEHRDEPFFLYMAHTFPHIPLFASDDFLDTSKRGLYGDVVEELDASVGTILQTLRELGLDKNTLVVFTSDNGPWLSEKENGGSAGLLRGGKGQTWDGGTREPGIFWWPGRIEKGSVVRELGSILDIYKTFCSLADVEAPAAGPLDSYDLSPVLMGKTSSPREVMYFYRGTEIYAVRQGPWKAHFITQGSFGEGEKKTPHDPPLLFHLEHDPGEKYDIAAEHPDVIKRLKELAEEQAAKVIPGPNKYKKRLDKK